MSLTPEQRANISRLNGSKSKGPVTEQGKRKSRANALQHGLRAEVLPLPNEDPVKVAQREQAWNDYYKPQSPAAQHLVNECVRATLFSDRAHAFHAAALSEQVREAEHWYDNDQADRVQRIKELWPTDDDPASVFRMLEQTAAGCRWLLDRWEQLNEVLRGQGFWAAANRDEALRLKGSNPKLEALKNDPVGYQVLILNQVAAEGPQGPGVPAVLDPKRMPQALWPNYGRGKAPDQATCRFLLEQVVRDELDRLGARELKLRQEHETPGRAEAAQRALVLKDEAAARRFLRCHAEARTTFHRAYAQLLKTLERDAAEGPAPEAPAEAAEEVSPNDPGEAIEAQPEPSPNEPSRGPADGPIAEMSISSTEPAESSPVSCGVEAAGPPVPLGAA
jgi:hypothetical protein